MTSTSFPDESINAYFILSLSRRAVFVDTDAIPALDSRAGDNVQNTKEAELVRQLAETLIRCGVDQSQIGILSLYRQQVKLLQHLLQDRQGVEILTADRSQGRDKDCIIISLVRSNEDGNVSGFNAVVMLKSRFLTHILFILQTGNLVKDWRRMNVSFTRARSKLVLFGSRKTLQREPLLAQFFKLMEEKKWILSLPSGSDSMHAKMFGSIETLPLLSGIQGKGDTAAANIGLKRRLQNGKENSGIRIGLEMDVPPVKKAKIATNAKGVKPSLWSARPILQDLVANEI